MKTNQFAQIIYATSYLSKRIDLTKIVPQICMLQKLHVRLQNSLEYLLIDPFTYENEREREKIKNCAREIKQYANEFNIQVNFEKLPNDHATFSKKYRDEKKFSSYWYLNCEITNLIVFVEKKKVKKQNTKIETLKSVELVDEKQIEILDDNGVDLNKIEGVDL